MSLAAQPNIAQHLSKWVIHSLIFTALQKEGRAHHIRSDDDDDDDVTSFYWTALLLSEFWEHEAAFVILCQRPTAAIRH